MAEKSVRAQDADRLSALHELSISVNSTTSLEELTATAMRQIIKVIAPDVVFFFHRQGDKLYLKDSWQVSVGRSMISPEIKQVGVCLCGLAASEKKPIYSLEISCDKLCTLDECKQAGLTSFAALPLHGVNEIIGVLSLGSFSRRDFGCEGHFLEIVSSQIAVAFQNVLFQNELKHKIEELDSNLKARYEAEKEKDQLREQLLQAQKMEAVGQLAGGIAHDFNNILSAIIGYAHLIQRKTEDGSFLQSYAEHILGSSHKAAQLVQSLLAFSRKQPLFMKAIDLNTIVVRMEKMLQRLIGEDISFITEAGGSELTVLADSSQIEQVLMKLTTNARDAMPNGGKLVVTSGSVFYDDPYIKKVGFGKPGKYAFLSFRDTGTGMNREIQEKIFEPFFTTKEIGKGTGLGLAMVYGIVKQHNGYVRVQSEPGKGTTFTVYLPLIDELKGDTVSDTGEYSYTGRETILVAEDDETLRKLAETVLRDSGYAVITAQDGDDALNKFKENQEKIRMCILDVIMPKKNGSEVYAQIKRLKPDMKAIFITGYSTDILNRSAHSDDEAVLLKPIEPQSLLSKVRELMAKYH